MIQLAAIGLCFMDMVNVFEIWAAELSQQHSSVGSAAAAPAIMAWVFGEFHYKLPADLIVLGYGSC